MRHFILFIIFSAAHAHLVHGQKPQSIYVSYFGETITHPGLKIGLDYLLKDWERAKTKKNGREKLIQKEVLLSPGFGFFHHKDYQNGLFVLPEFCYSRMNSKGNYRTIGIGAGYMRTFIPGVYELNSAGEVAKSRAGHNYLLANVSVAFGKDLSVLKEVPLKVFVKPQLLFATPSYGGGVWYFAMELGVKCRLIKKSS